MLGYIRNKTKHLIITLRFSILSIFAILFVIAVATIIVIFFYHINEIVQHSALLLMDKASVSISQELEAELSPPESASQFTASLINHHVLNTNNPDEISGYLISLLQKIPLANAMYWGEVDGNFIRANREANVVRIEIINRRLNPATNTIIYRDFSNKEIKRTSVPLETDPRNELWFKMALNQKRTVWTNVVVHQQEPAPPFLGLTVATPVFHADGSPWGVFGIHIRLDYLSHYITKKKISTNSDIIIINDLGKIIAAPELTGSEAVLVKKSSLNDIESLAKPWLSKAFKIYMQTNQSIFRYQENGVDYLATFKPITFLSNNHWLISIVIPASDFNRRIYHVEFSYVLIFLGTFVLGIVIMSSLVSRIITPIKKLVTETKKIKNFDLEGSQRVRSHIKEVVELSESIHRMKLGLRSFQKYVPASLVRQLIAANEDARIEGAKRDLAIFFSDIENFTTITEKIDSNELVKQLCEYLETFSRVISQNNGTIDKYIGDSVMAFWGAPLLVLDPCILAARTSLRCMELLNQLNGQWAKENKPVFLTRIGLHYGETIVGNIGSSERLNYTVIGDSVNITSRLVSANKMYGTVILVTEAVYQQVKELFVLRLVDQVKFKGKVESTAIYELIAESKQSIRFNVDAYVDAFAKAFSAYQSQQWREAMKFFALCLKIHPKDKVASIFIKRCEFFNIRPPDPNWDGVWHFSQK